MTNKYLHIIHDTLWNKVKYCDEMPVKGREGDLIISSDGKVYRWGHIDGLDDWYTCQPPKESGSTVTTQEAFESIMKTVGKEMVERVNNQCPNWLPDNDASDESVGRCKPQNTFCRTGSMSRSKWENCDVLNTVDGIIKEGDRVLLKDVHLEHDGVNVAEKVVVAKDDDPNGCEPQPVSERIGEIEKQLDQDYLIALLHSNTAQGATNAGIKKRLGIIEKIANDNKEYIHLRHDIIEKRIIDLQNDSAEYSGRISALEGLQDIIKQCLYTQDDRNAYLNKRDEDIITALRELGIQVQHNNLRLESIEEKLGMDIAPIDADKLTAAISKTMRDFEGFPDETKPADDKEIARKKAELMASGRLKAKEELPAVGQCHYASDEPTLLDNGKNYYTCAITGNLCDEIMCTNADRWPSCDATKNLCPHFKTPVKNGVGHCTCDGGSCPVDTAKSWQNIGDRGMGGITCPVALGRVRVEKGESKP